MFKIKGLLILVICIIILLFMNPLFTIDTRAQLGDPLTNLLTFSHAMEMNTKGEEAMKRGDYAGAIAFFTEFLRNTENTALYKVHVAYAFCNRGYAFSKLNPPNKGRDNLALADWDQAIKIEPNLVQVYKYRAEFYYDRKQYDKAWEDVQKIQELGSKVNPLLLVKLKKALGKDLLDEGEDKLKKKNVPSDAKKNQ